MAAQVPPAGGAQHLLAAIGDPLHRHLEVERREGDDAVLGVEARLHAEAAADVVDQDVDPPAVDPEHVLGQGVAHAGGHLAADAHRQPLRTGVVAGGDAARLDRRRRQALVGEREARAVGGATEGLVGGLRIAMAHLRGHVVGRLVAQGGRAGGRGRGLVDDGGQVLVVDEDRLASVERDAAIVRHDRRDRFADIAYPFHGERMARRAGGGRTVGPLEVGRHRRQGPDARREQRFARQDGMDPGDGLRLGDVDREDPGMRMRRAQEAQDLVSLVGDIVRVAAAPGEQRVVLDTAYRVAAAEALGDGVCTHVWIPWATENL